MRGDGRMKRDKSGPCELGVYNPSNVLVTEDGRSVPGSFLDLPQGSSHGSRIRSPVGSPSLPHSGSRSGSPIVFFPHLRVGRQLYLRLGRCMESSIIIVE